jgi:hypothetical protein
MNVQIIIILSSQCFFQINTLLLITNNYKLSWFNYYLFFFVTNINSVIELLVGTQQYLGEILS